MRSGLSSAETVLITVVGFAVFLITSGYVIGRIGFTIDAFLVTVVATAVAVALFVGIRDHTQARDLQPLIAPLAVVAIVLGWGVWTAWPSLLPLASGPDVTHHLKLIDYLEQHRRLPHGDAGPELGEMAHYTPGLHLLAVITGAWSGTDGLHTVQPVLLVLVALKAAFVFFIAMRLMPSDLPRVPFALMGTAMLFVSRQYFTAGFTEYGFFAQVAAELFAIAMWWALVVWDHRPSMRMAMVFAVASIGTFLTWPIWIGPPIMVFLVLALAHRDLPLRDRLTQLAVAFVPLAAAAGIHVAGRVEWLGIAATSGDVLRPSIAAFGWPLVLLAAAGFVVATDRVTRSIPLLIAAILLQAVVLLGVAEMRGAKVPYMALKMFYLMIYPMAALASLALAAAWRMARRFVPTWHVANAVVSINESRVAWLLLFVLAAGVGRTALASGSVKPIISEDLYQAGRWARANLSVTCFDYLVDDEYTAYWLHLAVLRNPRSTVRTAYDSRFVPQQTRARWIVGDAPAYAIADLRTLPTDVKNSAQVIAQFGMAAVLKGRGRTCEDVLASAGAAMESPLPR